MGSIHRRGTRDRPRFYLSFRTGTKTDGSPSYVMRAAKGAQNAKAARIELARIETAIARGEPWDVDTGPSENMGTLLERWSATLKNRSAYSDRLIIKRDLIPRFRNFMIAEVNLRVVLAWLDELAQTDMASQTQRHRLFLLSRFFSWAIESEMTDTNPCRMVPQGRRPPAKREKDVPWLEDDTMVPKIMAKLGPSLGLVYYLARFAGLREGEAAGLRMSDLEFLHEGLIRVRFSFDGELKESKNGSKPVKWSPSPVDAEDVLALHIKRRKLQGAKGDDPVFPYERPVGQRGRSRVSTWKGWGGYHPKQIRSTWRKVADDLGLPKDLTFYGASRHSYTTKALMAGASLDEVSAVLGHADPATTKRSYDHLIRRQFSPVLRQGLTGVSTAPSGETASDGQSERKG